MRNLSIYIFLLIICTQSLSAATSATDDRIISSTDSLGADTVALSTINTHAASPLPCDSVTAMTDSLVVTQDSIKEKKNLFQRFIAYFGDANKENNKKFDINFIGGPYYSSDTELGIGLVGAGLYRMSGCPKSMQPSNVSLFSSFSTVGFWMIGVRGNNLFPEDRYRLNYKVYLYSFPTAYWGIGYENGNNDENETGMKRFQANVSAEFLVRVANNLYLGPMFAWDYIKGSGVTKNIELFRGDSLKMNNYGIGACLQYDTRDIITNASKGIYFYLAQMLRPKWLGNDRAFYTTNLRFSFYQKVWKGGILAGDLKGEFVFGNPTWANMAKLGEGGSMRGYFEGRYRDKHSMAAQLELRQHVWRRNGLVAWIGVGNVFHDGKSFRHLLPNYGIGYRWEFKKHVNVRLDYGRGRAGQSGFTFNINEAF